MLQQVEVNDSVIETNYVHKTPLSSPWLQHLLEYKDRQDLGREDKDMGIEDLRREVTSIWQTDELRRHKPTPVDEARAGLHIVEQSLWKDVPHYLRRLSNAPKKDRGKPLPLTCTPIKFGSWMGGDRDGNPNVTAKLGLCPETPVHLQELKDNLIGNAPSRKVVVKYSNSTTSKLSWYVIGQQGLFSFQYRVYTSRIWVVIRLKTMSGHAGGRPRP